MSRTLFLIEDIDTVRRISVGRFWGVRISITPLTWLNPFLAFGLGLGQSLLNRKQARYQKLYAAFISMLATMLSSLCHDFGHILSGKLIKRPMDELLITATRDVTLYEGDQ